MSDLYIEARLQAIKDIASASCSDEKDADNIAGFCDEIYDAIPKLDKIVEELEKHKDTTDLTTVDEEMILGFTIYQGAFNEAIDRAIEIVKQGSDDNDVCKWESEKINNEWKPSCEPNSTYNVFGVAWFKRCPYCGKKIKVE